MTLEAARSVAQQIANETGEAAAIRHNLNLDERRGQYQAWSGGYNRSNCWFTNSTFVEWVEPEEGSYVIGEEN